jgi:hypothetical protein
MSKPQKAPSSTTSSINGEETNAKLLLEGSMNPSGTYSFNSSPSTAKHRFLAFPADISLISEENRILRMAGETEEFNKKSEKEKRQIKLNRRGLTVDSVATDLQKRKNAAAAQLRVQMIKLRGEEIPASLSKAHQLQQLQAQTNPEFRAKLDNAIIQSMKFGIHCDDDESIPWKGPSIALVEQSDELTEQERKLQEKEVQQHQLELNGKYWMSVYAAAQSRVGGAALRQQQIATAKLIQKQQNKRKSVLGGNEESTRGFNFNNSDNTATDNSASMVLSIPANANIPVSELHSDISMRNKSLAPKEILLDENGAVIEKPVVLSGRNLDFSAGESDFIERKRLRYEEETKKSLEQYRKRQEQEKKEEERKEKEKLLLQQQPMASSQIISPDRSIRRASQSTNFLLPAPAFSPIPPSAPSTARSTTINKSNNHNNIRNSTARPISATRSTTTNLFSISPRRSSAVSHPKGTQAYEEQKQKVWDLKVQKEKEALREISQKFQRNEDKRAMGLQAVLDRPQQILNDRFKEWAPICLHVKFVKALHIALRKKYAIEKLRQLFSESVRTWFARRKELKKVLAEARFGSFREKETTTSAAAIINLGGEGEAMNTEMLKSEYDTRSQHQSSDDEEDERQTTKKISRSSSPGQQRSSASPHRSRSQSPNSFLLNATTSFLRGSFEQNLVDAKRLDATFNPFTHNSNWSNEQLREMKALREEETQKRAPLSIHELLGCSLARGLVSSKSMEEGTKIQLLEKLRDLFIPVWTAPLNDETDKHRDACLCKELLENGQDYVVYVRRGHLAMKTHLDLNPDYYAIHVAESAYEGAKKTATAKYFELHPLAAAERDEWNKKQKERMQQQQQQMQNRRFTTTQQQQQQQNAFASSSSVNSASARFSTSQQQQQQNQVPSRPFSASSLGNNNNSRGSIPNNQLLLPLTARKPPNDNTTTQLLRQHLLQQNNMNNQLLSKNVHSCCSFLSSRTGR